jgi:putative ABC transport system permease protein
MIRNYFKSTVRNFKKHPFYSFINIIGLSIGISTCLLIGLWIQNELSFDQFINNKENIHQLWMNATFDGKVNSQRSLPFPAYQELRQIESGIKNTALANWGEQSLLSVGDKKIIKQSYHVTQEFLLVLPYKLIKGQADQILEDPSSLVLTKSTSVALFGDEDPLGKLVRVDNVNGVNELKVTGVLEDLPETSSLIFDCLMNIQRYPADFLKARETNWGFYSFQIFVELTTGESLEKVNNKIKDILTKKGQTDMPRELFLFPLEKWHLYDDFENGKSQGGLIDYIYAFAIIAALVLLMACINFMNLATARSEQRAKEIGIRKSIGSSRQNLIIQFLLEAVFSALLGFLFSLLLVYLVLPYFNSVTQKHLTLTLFSAKFWVVYASLVLITGFISGWYPAFYLSSFQPIHTLKGGTSTGKKGIGLRKVLVTIQFAFSAFLITSTLVIIKQIEYAKERDIGYDQQNLISI